MTPLPPVRIVLPPFGLAEAALLADLGLTTRDVYPLHGELIGAPRHYRYVNWHLHGRAPGYYYTAEGIRALAAHFQRPITLITRPEPPPLFRRFWWTREEHAA